MLILTRLTMHPSYLQKVFSFVIFMKNRSAKLSLSEKSRDPGGVSAVSAVGGAKESRARAAFA